MRGCTLLLLLATLLPAAPTHAEQLVRVGSYEVHYVVVGSLFITPEVASRYGLVRASEQALINISVLKDGTPIAARLSGHARDLLSRNFALTFKEVREGDAIYYLSNLRFSEQEHWRFQLLVHPEGEASGFKVEFAQRIYKERIEEDL